MFSVVIPMYNAEAFIRRSVDSVLSQTEPDYELVVIDDGSTDSSLSIVSSYQDDRLKVVEQENRGAGSARNRGIAEASGGWIAFLDADDMWRNDHLQELSILIREFGDAGLVSTRTIEVDTGKVPVEPPRRRNWKRRKVDYFRKAAVTPLFVHSSSVAIKRAVFDNVGYFSNFRQGEDEEFWVRVCLAHPCAVSDKPTSLYCRGTGGTMEQMWDKHIKEKRSTNTVRHIGPAVSYLVDALEAGNVCEDFRDSIAIFINSRITTELRILLYSGRLEQIPTVGGFYMPPLLFRHRVWKAIARQPRSILRCIYRVRSVLRFLYRFLANKAN